MAAASRVEFEILYSALLCAVEKLARAPVRLTPGLELLMAVGLNSCAKYFNHRLSIIIQEGCPTPKYHAQSAKVKPSKTQ